MTFDRSRGVAWLVALLASLLVTNCSVVVFGQSEETAVGGFAVGPLEISIEAEPGDDYERNFTVVTEQVAVEQEFTIEVKEIAQSPEGRLRTAPPGEGLRSCAEWIDVVHELSLAPDAREEVAVSLSCPSTAQGAYYAYIVVRLKPDSAGAPMAATVRPAARILVEVRIQGVSSQLGIEIRDLRIEANADTGTAHAVVAVANTGAWPTTVKGDVQLQAPAGIFPIQTSLPRERSGQPFEVYPGATISMPCQLPSVPPPGQYRARVRAIIAGQRRMHADFQLAIPEKPWDRVAGQFITEAGFKLSLAVEPRAIDLDLPRGATRSLVVRVRNNRQQNVQVQVRPTLVRIEPGGLMTYAERWPEDAPQWVEVRQDEFMLGPRQGSAVRMQATVPHDRPEHNTAAAAVLITAYAVDDSGQLDKSTMGEYPVLILARAPHAPPAQLESLGLDLIRPSPGANPTTALARLENVGGQVGRITGQIWLEGPGGVRLSSMEIGRNSGERILPDGEREFRLPIPPLDKGEHVVSCQLSVEGANQSPLEMEERFTVTTEVPAGLKSATQATERQEVSEESQ